MNKRKKYREKNIEKNKKKSEKTSLDVFSLTNYIKSVEDKKKKKSFIQMIKKIELIYKIYII